MEMAQALAKRILQESPGADRPRLDYAFLSTLGRTPKPAEADRLLRFLAVQRDEYLSHPDAAAALGGDAERAAWTALARVLFNLDDFMTRE